MCCSVFLCLFIFYHLYILTSNSPFKTRVSCKIYFNLTRDSVQFWSNDICLNIIQEPSSCEQKDLETALAAPVPTVSPSIQPVPNPPVKTARYPLSSWTEHPWVGKGDACRQQAHEEEERTEWCSRMVPEERRRAWVLDVTCHLLMWESINGSLPIQMHAQQGRRGPRPPAHCPWILAPFTFSPF